MFQDLRYGLRLMIRRPGFAAIAVATLALGIGTTTAIFAVTDHVLLRPVPYAAPDRLAVIWETSPTIPLPVMYASPPNLYEWQQRSKTFSSMGGFQWRDVTMGGVEPERIRAARVTAGLLPTLGVQPRMGRWFLPEEDRDNGSSGHGHQRRAVAAALSAEPQHHRTHHSDRRGADGDHRRDAAGVRVSARGGASRHAAGGAGRVVDPACDQPRGRPARRALSRDHRPARGRIDDRVRKSRDQRHPGADRALVSGLPDVARARGAAGRAGHVELATRVGLLVAAVGFVLLLACANVANLLLARGVGRRREFAIRTALGAGRGRLAMQVIVESAALAIAGGAAGLVLAIALVRVIVLLGPASMPGLQSVEIDFRTALFAVAASIAAALLAGVIPAVGVMRTRLANWLADRSGGSGPGAMRAQQALAIGQIGLAVALLVTASLLVESFRQLRAVDPGFKPAQVTTAKLTLSAVRYPDAATRTRFVDQLLSSLRELPGVDAAGLIDAVPLADNRQGTSFVRLDGPPADPTASPNANVAWITEGYFESIGVPLIAGRTFTAEDTQGRDRVIVINRLLAKQVFGTEDPLGRQVRVGASTQAPFQVIGVVGDERHVGVDADATPSFFVPYRQVPAGRDLSIIVRSAGQPAEAVSAITSFLGPLGATVSRVDQSRGHRGRNQDGGSENRSRSRAVPGPHDGTGG